MADPIGTTPVNPYNFSTVNVDNSGTVTRGGKSTGNEENTLLQMRDAFAPSQDDANTKASAAFDLFSKNPSNMVYLSSFTTANAAMLNTFGAITQTVKSMSTKLDEMNRALAN